MNGLKFFNFDDYYNRWPLDKVVDIVTKVKEYTDRNGIKDPELLEVEDQSWEERRIGFDNNRINIRIRYFEDGKLYEQILLIMKGEVIDGKEFHERYDEFYPGKKEGGK